MWRDFFATLKAVITLAEELKANREEIKEVRQELRDLVKAVYRLDAEVHTIKELEETEREHFKSQLENALLRFQQQLDHRLLDNE
jgi:uncharacterized membrane protein